MDTLCQRFPQTIAREKSHSLERYNRELRMALPGKAWRSWGDAAMYSAKRLGLLSARSSSERHRVTHRPLWFATARESVARIGRDAYQNPWKRTIDISIRRFREWWNPVQENQLWMAVSLIETSRLSKRTGRPKPIRPGWGACFTRNRFRITYEKTVTQRNLWDLCILRNTKVRFPRCSSRSCSVRSETEPFSGVKLTAKIAVIQGNLADTAGRITRTTVTETFFFVSFPL